MLTYRDYNLGREAGHHVERRLAAGNSLARAVLKRLVISEASCVTNLREGVDDSILTRFDQGGVVDSQHSIKWIVEVIRSYLSGGTDRLVVLEDALSRRGDPVIDRLQSRIRYIGAEVYYLLGATDANEYAIATSLSEADSPHQLVCVFTQQGKTTAREKKDADITQDELEEWARTAQAVVVSAYDGEGFVFCSNLGRR
jgi:hypothetical protein